MDNLIDYADFKKDIEKAFSELMRMFDLELIIVRQGLYILSGKCCILKFTFDRGEVFCEFKKTTDNISTLGYGIFEVLRFLYPNVKINIVYNPGLQLLEYERIIRENLKNVINGDFSWLSEFSKSEEQSNRIVYYILNNLNYHHPINRKMRSGDISWKQDFENYIQENKIKL